MVERKITFTEDFVLSERDGATDTEVFKIDTTGGNTIDCKVGRLAVNPPPAGEPPEAIDALIDFNNSTTRWVLGLDADDAGRFKLAVGSSLSSTTLLEVGDVDGEGVTIYSKDATATSHAVLKINSSAADAQLTFTGSSGSWSMGHREEDDAFFINAGTSLSTGHIAQYDSPGNTLGWDFLGNKARFRDTTGAADGRVEIVPEDGGDAYISFVGATSSWAAGIDESAGNFVISEAPGFGSTDRFVIGADGKFNFQPKDDSDNCDVNFYTPAGSNKDSFIRFSTDNGTDVYSLGQDYSEDQSFRITKYSDLSSNVLFTHDGSTNQIFANTFKLLDNSSVEHLNLTSTNLEVYVTTDMQIKHAVGSTDGFITLNPSDAAAAYIAFTGTTSTWSAGIDTAGNFVISEAQGFGSDERFRIRPNSGKFDFTATDGTLDCNIVISTPVGSNKDSFIRFSTVNGADQYSLGQDFSQNKSFRLTNNSDLTGTILFDYDPVDSTWDFFADTFKLLDSSSVEHLNLTSTNLEVYVTDNMRVKNATSDTSGWVTIQPSSNDDAKIVFQGPSTDAFTMGRNHGLGDFVITSGGNLDATPLANSDSTGHWVFSCPVDNRAASEMGNSSMTFWFNESENILQFSVKDAAGATHTMHAVMDE